MRQMPQSEEAEHGVLGSMLISPMKVVPLALEKLTAGDFYGGTIKNPSPCGIVFALIVECFNNGTPVDVITATNLLRERQQLEKVGGAAFITHLHTYTPTAASAPFYIDIVQSKAALRSTILECEAIAEAAYKDQPIQEIDERVHALASERSKSVSTGTKVEPMQSLVMGALERLEARHNGDKSTKGIGSGFPALDRKTNGWHPGQMIVIAAPEKQGKSSFARQLVDHAATVEKVPVAVFSYEMSREEIVDAMLLSSAQVDIADVNDGQTSEAGFNRLHASASKLAQAPIYIFDESFSTLAQYKANLRRAVKEYGVKLAMVDYLQLIAGDGDDKSREREVAAVSRATKQMAKELHIPILILCQLNEDGKTRESRAIQQDADKLIVIKHENPENEDGGTAWLDIKLSRSGAKGPVPVIWRPTFTRFDNAAIAPKQKPKDFATRPVTDDDFN